MGYAGENLGALRLGDEKKTYRLGTGRKKSGKSLGTFGTQSRNGEGARSGQESMTSVDKNPKAKPHNS